MPYSLPTVIFDLGGVFFTDGSDRAITVISERYLIDRQDVAEIFYGEVGLLYRENKITIEEFWQVAKKKWKIEKEKTDMLAQIWHEGYIPIEEVKNIVMRLKEKKVEVLYLSGSTKERVKYLENKYHFLQYFNDGIFTFSVGIRKPSPISYHRIIEKASNNANNCIYVDNSQKYLVPAMELGMRAILYKNPDNLRVELNKNGFVFL
jgi:HAD superfamily hydrolase (TIGR01509 family)